MFSLSKFIRQEEKIVNNMFNIKEKLNNNQIINQDDFIHIDYNDKNINFIKNHDMQFFDDCLDCFNISLECLNGYNFSGTPYVLLIKYQDKIIMSMFVFVHKNKFQFNMLITKYVSTIIDLDKNIHKNISLCMHSYAASLFGSNIIATRPLPFMLEILKKNVDLKKVNDYKDIFGINKINLDDFMGVADDDPTYYFEITEDFKKIYKQKEDILNFSYIKLS